MDPTKEVWGMIISGDGNGLPKQVCFGSSGVVPAE